MEADDVQEIGSMNHDYGVNENSYWVEFTMGAIGAGDRGGRAQYEIRSDRVSFNLSR